MHPTADQFEVGVLEHALYRGDAHAARRPLHDPQCHVPSLPVMKLAAENWNTF
jgi:hypothetical protein